MPGNALLLAAAAAAAAVWGVGADAGATTARRPLNVLLIVSDDLRPEMGCYGGEAVTPALDRLAASNGTVRFDRAYVQQAICCPTRSSFLTSRRPDTTGVWDLKTQFRTTATAGPGAANWTTLPQAFRQAGYATFGMGKIFHPVLYLNESDDVAGGSWSEPYFQPPGPSADNPGPLQNFSCAVANPEENNTLYSDGKTAAHAVQVLRQLAGNSTPFFVAVGFHRPHLPWVVPASFFDMYNASAIALADHDRRPLNYNATGAQPYSWDPQSGPRHCQPLVNTTEFPGEYAYVPNATARRFRHAYYAAVSQTDHNVGIVLDELEAQGHTDDTVVAFVGDHGWQLGDLGEFGKKTNFERATRAPFILRDPVAGAAGRPAAASSALVEFVDLMPTVLALALGENATPPLCPPLSGGVRLCTEGQSLTAVMAQPAGPPALARQAAFMQYAACMHDEFTWHDACDDPAEPRVMGYALRTHRWRYVEWVGFDKNATPPAPLWDQLMGSELYDHTDDDIVDNSAEAENLVARPELAAVVANLSKQLHAGWRAMRPATPTRNTTAAAKLQQGAHDRTW